MRRWSGGARPSLPVGPLSKYAHLAYPSEATERCGGRIKIKKFVSLLSIFPVRAYGGNQGQTVTGFPLAEPAEAEALSLEFKAAMIEFDFSLCSETTNGFPDGLMAAIENIGKVTYAVAPIFRNSSDRRRDLSRATRIERSKLLRDSHFMQNVKDRSVSEAVYVPVPRFQHFLWRVINGRHTSHNRSDKPLPAMKEVYKC